MHSSHAIQVDAAENKQKIKNMYMGTIYTSVRSLDVAYSRVSSTYFLCLVICENNSLILATSLTFYDSKFRELWPCQR